MTDFDNTVMCWFVMCDLASHNAKMPAYKYLADQGFEVFTPLHQVLKTQNGRRIRVTVPVIRDLLFVHSTKEIIDTVVSKSLHYRFKRGSYLVPIIVNNSDMERFIAAISSSKETKYYLPGEITPNMYGRKVRIIGGELNNYEGHLLSIQGSGKKRFIVEIPGFLSASVVVEKDYIEFI